jgi:hypothetical protein
MVERLAPVKILHRTESKLRPVHQDPSEDKPLHFPYGPGTLYYYYISVLEFDDGSLAC